MQHLRFGILRVAAARRAVFLSGAEFRDEVHHRRLRIAGGDCQRQPLLHLAAPPKIGAVGRILRQRIIGSSGLLLPRTPPD